MLEVWRVISVERDNWKGEFEMGTKAGEASFLAWNTLLLFAIVFKVL